MSDITYYDEPALKPSPWGWKVSTYIAIAGIAGAAQIIAAAANAADARRYGAVVRNGRYLALAGATAGAPLLIADLHTPQRWYNMLRIFRPTSPMSIGTYVLTTFGGLSAVLAAAQWRRDRGGADGGLDRAAALAQIPAAVAGAALSTYTGALLAATSTPVWAAAPRLLAALFGAASMASAAAALSLAAPEPRLDRLAAIAETAELGLLYAWRQRVAKAGVEPRGTALTLIAGAVPLLQHAAGKPRGAGVGTILGAFVVRHLVLRAGNRSATRPRDHFRLAAPR